MDLILEKPFGKKYIGFKYFDFVDVKAIDEEDRIIEGFMTARSLDREKDRVLPESFIKQFQRYEENPKLLPVILYVHDQRTRLPVGKVLKFEIRDGRIWFRGMISKATQFADEVWGQTKEGILKTFSFGYLLHEFVSNSLGGKDFKETEIAELSYAPVPVQPEALLENFKSLEEKFNLEKEDLKMSEQLSKDFTEFSNKMAQFSKDVLEKLKSTEEGQAQLRKMVDEKKVGWTPEEREFMDKLMVDMKAVDEKTGAISKELATRFPARTMEFPAGNPDPVFRGEKAYENVITTPVKFLDSDKLQRQVKEFDRMHDIVMVANRVMWEKHKNSPDPSAKFLPVWQYAKQPFVDLNERDGIKALQRLINDWQRLGDEITGGELTKVLAPGTAGSGLEHIPTLFSAELMDRVRANLLVAGRFNQIQAPSDPYKWPLAGQDVYGILVPPSTALPSAFDTVAAGVKTAGITFTHSKIRMRDGLAAEQIEDSIVSAVPYMNERLSIGAAKTLERAIINGQKTGTHQDDDVNAVSESSKGARLGISGAPLWNGLRWLSLNPESGTVAKQDAGGTGAFALADLWDAMALMGKFGLSGEIVNIFHTMGFPAYYLAMKFAQLETIEKFGPFATVKEGVLVKVLGGDVLPSGEFPTNLAATGVNTLAGPNNTTGWLIVNGRAFAVSYRRGFTLESVRYAPQDMFDIIGFLRVDFQPWFQSGNGKFGQASSVGEVDPPASYVFNIIK